jgi:hypothetical protein
MKTKYQTIPLNLIFILVFISCSKQHVIDYPQATKFPSVNCSSRTNNIDTIRLMMTGTYEWVRTAVSSRAGTEYTNPYTEQMTYKYVFRSDSTVELYENGRFRWSNKYIVDYELPIILLPSAGTVVSIIDKTTSNRIDWFYPYLCNDSAIFSNPGSVDASRYFTRK